MENPSSSKKAFREHYQAVLNHLTIERKKSASEQAETFLPSWIDNRVFNKKGMIAVFSPFKGEIDLWPVYRLWLSEHRLIFPKISGTTLSFHQIHKIEDLSPSIYSLLEPNSHLPEVPLEEIFLILVPGLAFDNEYYRLGRGLGFYDRLLSLLPLETPRVGIGYKEQLSPVPLPRAHHDQKVTDRLLF